MDHEYYVVRVQRKDETGGVWGWIKEIDEARPTLAKERAKVFAGKTAAEEGARYFLANNPVFGQTKIESYLPK